MHEALIRFAPVTTVERLNDPRRKGRALYDSGSLKFWPHKPQVVPLVIDHDLGREVGTVDRMHVLQDVDGPWHCAVASLTDCPAWLTRGTRASFQYRPLQTDSFGNNILRNGYISEVSVLSPGVEPYEPLAQVLYVKPKVEKPKPAPSVRRSVHRSLAPTVRRITPQDETDELMRRLDWFGHDVPMELIMENMRRELDALRRR